MDELSVNYFILNEDTLPVKSFENTCRKISFGVYEVVRLMKGIPLFGEDHFNRMAHSLQLVNKQCPIGFNDFEARLKHLAEANNRQEGNIKIVADNLSEHILLFFIPHYYPTEHEYRTGVKTGFYRAERTNPNAKTHLFGLREKVNVYLKEKDFFEVFYIDNEGLITEGSRSNVFFIRNGIVYTCPSEKVLLGITRQKVIECIRNLNIPLVEESVCENEAASFESVFLTGTSPKVLPVSGIDGHIFSCENETMQTIRKEYDRMANDYIQSRLSPR